jgi:hypothetical protein
MPAQLADRLAEAHSALYRHPERALLSWYRYAIYNELTSAELVRGGAARARLDILAVRRALFCWPPGADDLQPAPGQLLALAEQLLVGSADRAGIARQLNRAHALADIAGADISSPRYCGWCVYEAALRALGSAYAYYQLRAGPASASYDVADTADDASSYAAVAVAGGAWHLGQWDWQTEEAQLRRAVFWEWWLREAVPAAWHMQL